MTRARGSVWTILFLVLTLVTAAAPRAHASGMPQLNIGDPLTTWQVVWGGVIFALLYLVLSRSALPRVASVIENRQRRIEGDLDAAHKAKSDADRATAELRNARRQAAAEAQANLDRVAAEARESAATQAREMNARLDARLAEAEQRIGAERTQAMGALRGIASDTAQLLVERVTGKPADPAALTRAIDGALAAGDA